MPEEDNRQQFHDVNRPGRTGPTPTSRPVIVGHRPTMPDPMVNQRPMHHPGLSHQQPHQPQPLSNNQPELSHQPEPPRPPQPAFPSSRTPSIDGFTSPLAAAGVAHQRQANQPVQDSMPNNNGTLIAGEPLQSPPFEAHPHHHHTELHRQTTGPETDPLFHGHHTAGEHPSPAGANRRRLKWRMLILALILVLIGLYLAIDSGLIHSSIKLPFHIFPQAEPPVYTPYFQ